MVKLVILLLPILNAVITFEGNGNNHGFTRLNLLQIAYGLVVNIFLRCQHNYRHTFNNKCQSAVFKFTGSVRFSMNIADFLQFQRLRPRKNASRLLP